MERIVDIATDGRHLSVLRGFMIVSQDREEVGRVPLDDIAAVIVHAHGITWSTNLVVALAERGALMVLCAANHAPVAVCLPLEGHHAQNAHFRAQWEAARPLCKQLWRRVVVAKIRWQAAILEAHGRDASAFDFLARKVGSGDPENVEAQAARRYWPLLMGEDFRRDRAAEGANGLLNYGYTILRAAVARAIMGSGLFPALGIFHRNRYNAFPLADDLMEPYRPFIDEIVYRLYTNGHIQLTREVKGELLRILFVDTRFDKIVRPLEVGLTFTTSSIAKCFAGTQKKVSYPMLE